MTNSNNQLFNDDPYFKKLLTLRFRNQDLKFKTSQALFSSQDIDLGTKHLLRTLSDENYDNYEKVLDLGSGYGPIGIALKSARPSSIVHMVDKDALAISYSKQNSKINNVSDIQTYGSLGYDNVSDKDFDLIASNIPAKVGNEVLSHMLKDARYFLKPGGRVAVVVIDAIGEYISKVLSDPEIKIVFHKRWPGHLVFHYEFLPSVSSKQANSFEKGIYDRSEKQITLNNTQALLKTTYNLAEFDTLSFETELLLKSLKTINKTQLDNVIVFNPGQGFIPVALSKITTVNRIHLMDRDLQSLKISHKNLIDNDYSSKNIVNHFQVGILTTEPIQADYIVGILDEKDNQLVNAMIIRQAAAQLKEGGHIIIASNSTAITRIASLVKKEKRLTIITKEKQKGRSSIILKQRV